MTGSSIHDNDTGGVLYSGVFHQDQGKTLTFDIESNTMRQTMVPDSNIAIRLALVDGFTSDLYQDHERRLKVLEGKAKPPRKTAQSAR